MGLWSTWNSDSDSDSEVKGATVFEMCYLSGMLKEDTVWGFWSSTSCSVTEQKLT